MTIRQDILEALAQRRRELRMPISVLSERANTSASTVKRVLSGDTSISFRTLARIAQAMGASLDMNVPPADRFIRKEARRKAQLVIRIVQGTSALEAQAVDKRTVETMRREVEDELCAHPGSKLWAK